MKHNLNKQPRMKNGSQKQKKRNFIFDTPMCTYVLYALGVKQPSLGVGHRKQDQKRNGFAHAMNGAFLSFLIYFFILILFGPEQTCTTQRPSAPTMYLIERFCFLFSLCATNICIIVKTDFTLNCVYTDIHTHTHSRHINSQT